MFGPDYKAGCPSCSMIADGFNGFAVHLANHDVMRGGERCRGRRWRSWLDTSSVWGGHSRGRRRTAANFNYDFNVSITEEQQRAGGVEYNYRRGGHPISAAEFSEPVVRFAASCGTDAPTFVRDRPGMSAFARESGVLYHTYSAYARGLDGLWGAYQWLDRAPKGRNERGGTWWRRHDEYAGG